MKQEAQRIAIAEICGIIRRKSDAEYAAEVQYFKEVNKEPHPHLQLTQPERWEVRGKMPNFPDDLNAMHKAIKSLNYDELMRWHVENRDIAYRDRTSPELTDAPQRAEAFLRVKGKWNDNQ